MSIRRGLSSILLITFSYWGASCSQPGETFQDPLFIPVPADHSGIDFVNLLFEDEALNIITFEYFYNGAGVGVGDINNDGLQDLFFSANMAGSKLYLNQGNFVFEDITQAAGINTQGKWATGVSMVDINQDGWMDIYVCYAGPYADPSLRANELYINQGNNTFLEQAQAYGLADTGHSTQAAFFDYDQDDDLDMYLLTNITDRTGPNVIRPKRLEGQMPNTDRLYRNDGTNAFGQVTFTNVSSEAGILAEGYGLGLSIRDINNDGWPDIYVSNDYLSNDLLYINGANGVFTDRAGEYLRHQSYSAMGNDIADYNNDGLLDIITLDMLPYGNRRKKLMFGAMNYDRYHAEIRAGYQPQFMRNTLQLNTGMDLEGNPSFSEISQLANIHETDWSWAPLFADFDLDGWKDLMVTNGYPKDITNRDFADYKMQGLLNAQYDRGMNRSFLQAINSLEGVHIPNFLFKNRGDLSFSDVSAQWGFQEPSYSTGAAFADLDNDGDLDLVINNTESKAFLLKNQAEKKGHHYLKIKLKGAIGNRQGLGAKVNIYYDGQRQFHEHSIYRGYQSSVDPHIFFGLGQATEIDSLRIVWPGGKTQVVKEVRADQTITLEHDATSATTFLHKDTSLFLFREMTEKLGVDFHHQDMEYPDFHTEPLLPHQFSKNGPGIAIGDVNGDQRDDFYIGAASGQTGAVFIQQPGGTFQPRVVTQVNKLEEDLGALFFDADQDGDNDLYVVSGSNEFPGDSPHYQDRLYMNDGLGHFSLAEDALPPLRSSGSCVLAADYDRDGDLDLFIGGRVSPQRYPEAPRSYLLRNDQGKFTDVTLDVCPALEHIGLVSAALWTDFDGDTQVDLIVVGEWMPISFFRNVKGKFENVSDQTGLSYTEGWWNSLNGADFDRDGDIDYLVGNLGLNSAYKASVQEPVTLYAYDFNNDERVDPILCRYIQGEKYPVHPLDDMIGQINSLKKTFTTYRAYADSHLEDVFPSEQLEKARLLEAFKLESAYLENLGQGKFRLHTLPIETQFAPIYGIQISDYDADGHLDALLTGNSYAPEVLGGRYDAFNGLMLKGNGNGTFQAMRNSVGFTVKEDGKSLSTLIDTNGRKLVLAARNNQLLKIFEWQAGVGTRTLPLQPNDAWVELYHVNGQVTVKEAYYGEGYLSQSSRRISIPQDIAKLLIRDYQGQKREVQDW